MPSSIAKRAASVSLIIAILFTLSSGGKADQPPKRIKPNAKAGAYPLTRIPAFFAENDFLEITKNGHIIASPGDVLCATRDRRMQAAFEGKTLEVFGLWVVDNTNPSGSAHFRVEEPYIECGDLRRFFGPIVKIEYPPHLAHNTWVRIVGTVTFPAIEGSCPPVIHAKTVESCGMPEEILYQISPESP